MPSGSNADPKAMLEFLRGKVSEPQALSCLCLLPRLLSVHAPRQRRLHDVPRVGGGDGAVCRWSSNAFRVGGSRRARPRRIPCGRRPRPRLLCGRDCVRGCGVAQGPLLQPNSSSSIDRREANLLRDLFGLQPFQLPPRIEPTCSAPYRANLAHLEQRYREAPGRGCLSGAALAEPGNSDPAGRKK